MEIGRLERAFYDKDEEKIAAITAVSYHHGTTSRRDLDNLNIRTISPYHHGTDSFVSLWGDEIDRLVDYITRNRTNK